MAARMLLVRSGRLTSTADVLATRQLRSCWATVPTRCCCIVLCWSNRLVFAADGQCAARRGGPLTPPGVFVPAEALKRGLPARTATQVHAIIVAAGPTGADAAHAAAELRGFAEDPPHEAWRISWAGRPPSHATGPEPGAAAQ